MGNPDLSRRSIFPLENPEFLSENLRNASVFKSPPAVNSSIMYQYLYMYIIYNDYLYMCIYIIYIYIYIFFYRPHATHVASSMGHATLKSSVSQLIFSGCSHMSAELQAVWQLHGANDAARCHGIVHKIPWELVIFIYIYHKDQDNQKIST